MEGFMAYRDNVSALAAKLGIPNDPGLREEDMEIAALSFYEWGDDALLEIQATDMNRAGRLFFQAFARHSKSGHRRTILRLSDMRAQAEEYFAERWEPTNDSYPPLIGALHDEENCSVKITWKPNVLSEQEFFNQG